MGVDLYAGPLCRYLARDFTSPTARLLPGVNVAVIGSDGKVFERRKAAEVRPFVLDWRRTLNQPFRQNGADGVIWDEMPNAPYWVEQVRWDGWNGLKLWAAYCEFPDFTPPDELPARLDQDAAWATLGSMQQSKKFPFLLSCAWWFPVMLKSPTLVTLPMGNQALVGAIAPLVAELNVLERDMAQAR